MEKVEGEEAKREEGGVGEREVADLVEGWSLCAAARGDCWTRARGVAEGLCVWDCDCASALVLRTVVGDTCVLALRAVVGDTCVFALRAVGGDSWVFCVGCAMAAACTCS